MALRTGDIRRYIRQKCIIILATFVIACRKRVGGTSFRFIKQIE